MAVEQRANPFLRGNENNTVFTSINVASPEALSEDSWTKMALMRVNTDNVNTPINSDDDTFLIKIAKETKPKNFDMTYGSENRQQLIDYTQRLINDLSANPFTQNQAGQSALSIAINTENTALLNYLTQSPLLTEETINNQPIDAENHTLLSLLAEKEMHDITTQLQSRFQSYTSTPENNNPNSTSPTTSGDTPAKKTKNIPYWWNKLAGTKNPKTNTNRLSTAIKIGIPIIFLAIGTVGLIAAALTLIGLTGLIIPPHRSPLRQPSHRPSPNNHTVHAPHRPSSSLYPTSRHRRISNKPGRRPHIQKQNPRKKHPQHHTNPKHITLTSGIKSYFPPCTNRSYK